LLQKPAFLRLSGDTFLHTNDSVNLYLAPEIAVNYQLGGEVRLIRFVKCELIFFRADIADLTTYLYREVWPDPLGRSRHTV